MPELYLDLIGPMPSIACITCDKPANHVGTFYTVINNATKEVLGLLCYECAEALGNDDDDDDEGAPE
jgi:hypothetical protein